MSYTLFGQLFQDMHCRKSGKRPEPDCDTAKINRGECPKKTVEAKANHPNELPGTS